MIPKEWLDRYYLKSGDDHIVNTQYFHTCEHGFASWNIVGDAIIVVQCFGNGKFWLKFFRDLSDRTELKMRFVTTRNPKALTRSIGAKIIGYIMEVE